MKYVVLDIETTGLNPLEDRITCICAKTNYGKRFSMSHIAERKILTNFLDWLEALGKDYTLISKNGKQFDLPFIIVRCANKKIDYLFYKSLFDYKHIDIQELTKKRVSLQSMAELYNLDGKLGTGVNAIQLFKDKKYIELKEYCMQDVLLTEKVYITNLWLKNETKVIY